MIDKTLPAVCLRSLDPFYLVATFWTCSSRVKNIFILFRQNIHPVKYEIIELLIYREKI